MPAIDAIRAAVILAAAFLFSNTALASGDPAEGRKKALQCQTCHGLDGVAKIPEAPHIGGQNEFYLIKSLRAYKDGLRKDDMMSIVVTDLSDDDIANLAAYYASLEPKNE